MVRMRISPPRYGQCGKWAVLENRDDILAYLGKCVPIELLQSGIPRPYKMNIIRAHSQFRTGSYGLGFPDLRQYIRRMRVRMRMGCGTASDKNTTTCEPACLNIEIRPPQPRLSSSGWGASTMRLPISAERRGPFRWGAFKIWASVIRSIIFRDRLRQRPAPPRLGPCQVPVVSSKRSGLGVCAPKDAAASCPAAPLTFRRA